MLDPVKLHDIALTLENEREFHDKYKARAPYLCHGGRRDLIQDLGRTLISMGRHHWAAEDREQLRRYFDDIYDMPATVVHKAGGSYSDMSGLPTIEFWRDEVKYPAPKPPSREILKHRTTDLGYVPIPEAVPPKQGSRPKGGSLFDTSFVRESAATPEAWEGAWTRSGIRWTPSEETQLGGLFEIGATLAEMAVKLQRRPAAVVDRLVGLNLLRRTRTDPRTFTFQYYVRMPGEPPEDYLADVPGTVEVPRERLQQEVADHLTQAANHFQNLSNNLKEIIMNKTDIITIETKTYVNGVDISTLDDGTVYNLIAAQESEIEALEKIKTKPKKLIAEIEKRKAGIAALVAYLDSKE